jgi:hypothetical protein
MNTYKIFYQQQKFGHFPLIFYLSKLFIKYQQSNVVCLCKLNENSRVMMGLRELEKIEIYKEKSTKTRFEHF